MTPQEIRAIEISFPVVLYAWTMLRIIPNFLEPVDDDIPIEEERRLHDSEDELEDDDDGNDDPNLGAEAYSPESGDDMDEI